MRACSPKIHSCLHIVIGSLCLIIGLTGEQGFVRESGPWQPRSFVSSHEERLVGHFLSYMTCDAGKGYVLDFSSSNTNCFGRSTGTTMPMGSPRLIVVGFVSCRRKFAVKAS